MLKTKYNFFTSGLIFYFMSVCFNPQHLQLVIYGDCCMSFGSDMSHGTVCQISSLTIHSKVNFPVSFQLFPWNTSGRVLLKISQNFFLKFWLLLCFSWVTEKAKCK